MSMTRRLVGRMIPFCRLDLNYELLIHQQVHNEVADKQTIVEDLQTSLLLHREPSFSQFADKRIFIYFFKKTISKLLVNGYGGSFDLVAL